MNQCSPIEFITSVDFPTTITVSTSYSLYLSSLPFLTLSTSSLMFVFFFFYPFASRLAHPPGENKRTQTRQAFNKYVCRMFLSAGLISLICFRKALRDQNILIRAWLCHCVTAHVATGGLPKEEFSVKI